jgi:uncharacterized membrane protein YjjP (DUF1212 family)
MQLDAASIVALVLFGSAQTGALIFFAGKVASTLQHHGNEIAEIKKECAERRRISHQELIMKGHLL